MTDLNIQLENGSLKSEVSQDEAAVDPVTTVPFINFQLLIPDIALDF